MPRTSHAPKEITLNLRLDSTLKAEFMAVAGTEDKPAAEVLRNLIREYVQKARRKAFLTEAARQSNLIANCSSGRPEEIESMRWVENVSYPLPEESGDEWFNLPNDGGEER
jgi:predicted AAA+ superfamily ATPase